MTASLDRAAFFGAVRAAPFGGSLSQGQVSGMGSILDACPPDLDTDALAYCLATAFHETARTMLPVKEKGGQAYYLRMYDIRGDRPAKARELGNTSPGDGAKFAGRGYVQLTGRSNYRRATGELQNRGYLTRDQDLTVTPDMAMTPDIAAAILFCGMTEGWFTGRKLSQYFGPGRAPIPIQARRIINALDKADAIAGHFADFRVALVAARHLPGAVTKTAPVPSVEVKPLPPAGQRNYGTPTGGPKVAPAAPPAKAGFWAKLGALIHRTDAR